MKIQHRLHRKTLIGFLAMRLPLLSTLLILAIIGVIVGNFIVTGASSLSWEFITSEPRNMNTEGGIFPAIYGTFLLVIIMTAAAVPIGTITAVYLTEYAKQNSWFARTIRFAVNTLAGVPSIVFGLFGLGFFIQTVGSQMDRMSYSSKMNDLHQTLVATSAPLAGGADSRATVTQVQDYLKGVDEDRWYDQIRMLNTYPAGTVAQVKEADVMSFLEQKPDLKWGKPNLLWAAMTLALLTLPVVIVSVEEALRTVPGDLRAASLALGATRWETIRKIVIPNSLTGILTGSILAISRGAGEVAPILFTGAIYSQQDLPSSPSDQFMHLGYHLYILATQSPDVDATRPLQYATSLVLLALTLALNLSAILLRSRIRKRQFA
jgi:ABC-type phosphate transport system permease subunit